MLDLQLAVIGALSIVLGLASRPFRDLPLSEPLVAMACGVLLGPRVVGLLDVPGPSAPELLRTVAELSLAISLMAVALRYPLERLRGELLPLALLLTVALTGMAAVTTGLGLAILGVPLAHALLVGAVLAPTDPILASSVVTGEPAERDLPTRLRVLLSVESGANDGLAFALVAVSAAALAQSAFGQVMMRSAVELAIGLVVGVLTGFAVGRLVAFADHHHDIEHAAFLVLTVALAGFVLGLSKTLGGQGLIAVFVAGLAYNHEVSRRERMEEWEVQEAVNRFLVLPVFVFFGLALPWAGWSQLGWSGPAFAAAVLLLRRVPLLLLLARPLRLRAPESAFLGWFGPIGVAALFYLADGRVLGQVEDGLWWAGTLVVAVSTLLHGLTSSVGRKALARRTGGS